MNKTILHYKTKMAFLVHQKVIIQIKSWDLWTICILSLLFLHVLVSNLQYSILIYPFFKNYDTVKDKILFSRYKKNHSHIRNALTISYSILLQIWFLFYSRFDLFQVKLHRFHDLYNGELNDNFMRQPLAIINLSICIPLWYAIRKLSSQNQDSHWRVTLCLD